MSATNPSVTGGRQVDDRYDVSKLKDVMDETVSGQVLQRLERIERTLSSMEERFGGRLGALESRLDGIEARLTGRGGAAKKVTVEKVPLRNVLIGMMQKGWVSETDLIAKTKEFGTAWQTIGVRSLVTKLGGLGIAVETDTREGVPHYRIAK